MNFAEYIIYLFNFAVAIGAVLAFIMIAYYGIKLLNSQGNPSAFSEAKKKIINSLLGIAILLTSYILLTTINPNLIEIKGVSLGNTQITIPIITPTTQQKTLTTYTFEELPIGTLTEGILAGTSSNKNEIPCYEYEHSYGSDDNIIIANTIDRNKDGKIDSKDIILDKDIFYCFKLLSDAVAQKTEVHLNRLIAELDGKEFDNSSMRQCSCQRCHPNALPTSPFDAEIVYPSGPGCLCPSCGSSCTCCGNSKGCQSLENLFRDSIGARGGCPAPIKTNSFVDQGGFKQYAYDPCPNRLEINCKRQAIKELMDGTPPEDICYSKGYIKTKSPYNLFTIKTGIERMEKFKSYFETKISELKAVEAKMKSKTVETLSEYHELENSDTNNIIGKTVYNNYDISRYCDDYCAEKKIVDGKEICIKRSFDENKRVCAVDKEKQEHYSYNGDGATFYFSEKYNKEIEKYSSIQDEDKNCSIEEQNIKRRMYGGLIPIGETVDYSEEWGAKVIEKLDKVIGEANKIYSTGLALYNLPENCACGNCKNSGDNCCINYSSVCDCEGCCCPSVSCVSCRDCEPTEILYEKTIIGTWKPVPAQYVGCSSFCGGESPTKSQAQAQYWVCPYGTFCEYMKDLYTTREIETSCYEETDDKTEEATRNVNKAQIGYLQTFEELSKDLLKMAEVDDITDEQAYPEIETFDLINTICPNYLQEEKNKAKLTCNENLSVARTQKRFDLLDKLTLSRIKLTGCVTSYGYPYKKDLSRVFSCYEGINLMELEDLDISPGFPYPRKTDKEYWNCYPYNSDYLTTDQKKICFYNINRTGVKSNPGCLMITEDYMDNYYCCE